MNDNFARIDRLPPYVFSITGDLKQKARAAGEDIIDFGMGNPDQPTPQHIVDKLIETAQRGDTHRYSQSKGIPRLRRAICTWYKNRYGVDLNENTEAIVTLGSKEGLAHLALATTGPGDAILVPNPSYPIHPYGFVISGADIRHVPMGDESQFFDELENAIRNSWPRPKMLVLNFPSNPTTHCVELEFFERVVAIAKEHQIWVVQDLAYADLCFDGYVAPSIMQVEGAKDVAVEFFTMSKSYNMPGWRVGFCVGNSTLIGALARVKSYLDYGMFTPVQVAAIAALEGDQSCVSEIAALYKSRRDVLCNGLNSAGWPVTPPKATMFVWAKIPEPYQAMGSLEFAKKLLTD
ncbi:MAG: alanine transaminase, partial [Proteobacteria bacterium]|nr:alanine transaminase [Pseudomonadota bacterium]